MKSASETPLIVIDETTKIRRYALICAVTWTLLLSGLFMTYVVDNRNAVKDIGRSVAEASFEKDILFRRWAARHGGVYVPETPLTPANPYLAAIPERDITTPSGKRLTLLNPAYMTRQIFELAHEQGDLLQGHITSLKPVRPENAPDPWETRALNTLEGGAKEVVEPVLIDGRPFLRFMRPLFAEKPCLRCHAAQGYAEGDSRGGISVTLSLLPIQRALNSEMKQEAFIHGFIWLLGLGFIWFGTRKIVRTMTSLRHERNSLRESKEHYRAIIEAFDGQIYICSNDYKIEFMNEKMIERTGRNAVGEPCFKALHDLESICPWCVNERVFKGEFVRWEVQSPKDGRWYHVANSPIHNEDGTISKQAMIQDITEQKQAEEERRAMEQQFHHAQKLESLGVLAGGIAHDFNNILTIILGHCYLAREDMIPEHSFKEHFQQIETAGNRAADLCRQMLTYAGRSPLVQTQVDLWPLVDEVVKMLQAAIRKNVTIEIDLEHDVPEIKGDTGQIQQIVMNMIINAAEAIGDAHGTIRVVLTKTLFEPVQRETDTFGTVISPGSYACLEVTDTGSGMDEETQKRIFEPFYTTKFAGRGLGMSAIRGIVTSHEGILHLSSTPGVGTTFKVCFPVPESFDYAENAPTAAVHPEKGGGTVLLVDDEQNLRDMGTSLLEAMGFSALTAQHGREALEIYCERSGEIDLVLLDLIMPVMGGIETYAELRKVAPILPVIICSGYGIETVADVIEHDLHAGFVHKPYRPEQLREMMLKMKAL